MPPLKNPRHEKYAVSRFEGQTTIDAYVNAGFGGKKNPRENARTNAHKLENREDIRERITELQEAVAKKSVLTRGEAEMILTYQARGNLTDFVECDEQGVRFHIALNKDIDNPQAIKKITTRTERDREGTPVADITTLELHPQRDAVVALAKMKGWVAPKRIQMDVSDVKRKMEEMSDEDLLQLVAELLKGRGEGDSTPG